MISSQKWSLLGLDSVIYITPTFLNLTKMMNYYYEIIRTAHCVLRWRKRDETANMVCKDLIFILISTNLQANQLNEKLKRSRSCKYQLMAVNNIFIPDEDRVDKYKQEYVEHILH
jgi:hypothetical protein